jgi:DNA-binding MarR family transcriptional regulator
MDINTVIQKFISTDRLHHTLLEKQVSKGSLHRSQHRILLYVYKSSAPLTQKEIAEHFEVSPAAVAVALKKLEASGYIKRDTKKRDMRCNSVTVTKEGERILFQTKALVDKVDSRMFEDFSSEELTAFYGCLEKMQKNLNEFDARDGGKNSEKMV